MTSLQRLTGPARKASNSRAKTRKSTIPNLEELESRALLSGEPLPGGLTPQDVQTAYGFNSVAPFIAHNQTYAANGQGQTIAILDAGGDPNLVADLTTFNTQFNLPQLTGGTTLPLPQVAGSSLGATLKQVNETGGSTLPQQTSAIWVTETDVDVEWAHAIAPGANIVLVEMNPSFDQQGAAHFTDADLQSALQTAENLGASVVSMSFGMPDDPEFAPPPGVTYVSAAGDAYGVFNTASGAGSMDLTVGGTAFDQVGPLAGYPGEQVWGASGDRIGTSYGAYQASIPLPSWQTAAAADVAQQTGMPAPTSRMVPDVSMVASNLDYVDSTGVGTSNPWQIEGGTSLATPMWAGLIAISNEGRALELPGRGALNGIDPTLPMLYSLPSSDFNHVTTPTDPNDNYYDQQTGLGTPKANLIIPALVAPFNNYYSALNSSYSNLNSNQLTIYGNSSGTDTITVSLVTKDVPVANVLEVVHYVQVQDNNQTDLFPVSSVQSIVLNTRAAADNVIINSTPAGVPLTINLGAGTDSVTINGLDAGPGVSGLGGAVTVNGGSGSDTLIVNDQMPVSITPTSTLYYVTDWSIQRNTGNTVNFDNLSQVTLNGVPPSSGNGGVAYFIGSTSNNSAPVLMSQPGATALSVDGSSTGEFENTFYVGGGVAKYLGANQTLNVSTGTKGQNAVYVYTLPAGVALNISSAGPTQDSVYIGQGSEYSLVNIKGAINVSNSSGQTSLIVDGSGDPGVTYTLTNTTLSVSNGPTITYRPAAPLNIAGESGSLVGVTSIEVIEGGANDCFDAESAPAQTSVSVYNTQTSNPQLEGPAASSIKVL